MTGQTEFSTEVHLACKLRCGPEGSLQISGTTLRLDSRVLLVSLPANAPAFPELRDALWIEIPLPELRGGPQKYLYMRGRVSQVIELASGERRLEVQFRRAVFRDAAAPERSTQAPEKGTVM